LSSILCGDGGAGCETTPDGPVPGRENAKRPLDMPPWYSGNRLTRGVRNRTCTVVRQVKLGAENPPGVAVGGYRMSKHCEQVMYTFQIIIMYVSRITNAEPEFEQLLPQANLNMPTPSEDKVSFHYSHKLEAY